MAYPFEHTHRADLCPSYITLKFVIIFPTCLAPLQRCLKGLDGVSRSSSEGARSCLQCWVQTRTCGQGPGEGVGCGGSRGAALQGSWGLGTTAHLIVLGGLHTRALATQVWGGGGASFKFFLFCITAAVLLLLRLLLSGTNSLNNLMHLPEKPLPSSTSLAWRKKVNDYAIELQNIILWFVTSSVHS